MKSIDRRKNLKPHEFRQTYLIPSKPVIITDFADIWPAKSRWTPQYFKKNYGHIEVPVYSKNFIRPGKNYMAADRTMKFGDYLELIEANEQTDLRLFLFNIFKHAPELKQHFYRPDIMGGFMMRLPLMFFGCAGSSVPLHYDVDLSHVFHTQFYGTKRVVLYPPDQSVKLYRHPFTVRTPVDVDNPDLKKYPRFKEVDGYEDELQPGETLFIPTAYWHLMHYTSGGFAMSLRSNESIIRMIRGVYNIAFKVTFDKAMNRALGQKWNEVKERIAVRRAG